MKKIILLFTLSFSLLNFVNAQTPPNAFNYSAVARNAAGQPIATATIGIQISILKTTALGTVVYSENHFVNTDSFGLFNLIVGAGAVQSGSMNTIQWSTDNFYLKVGMDINGGTNFLTMGTTQLLSVPYAIHAATADSIAGVAVDGSETVIIAGNNVSITGSGTTADPYIVNATGGTPGTIPTVTTDAVQEIIPWFGSNEELQSKVTYTVSSDGGETILSRGICYSTSPNPTTSGNGTIGAGVNYWLGTDTTYAFNLQPNTTYYIRTYAVNVKGTAYGNEVSFTTTNVQLATLVTDPVSSFQFNQDGSVNTDLNGQLINDGGQLPILGYCYATSPNPTLNDNVVGYYQSLFSTPIVGLLPNTTYYVRAYGTNIAGTAYGNQVIFTTPQVQLPTVQTFPVTNLTGAPGPSFNATFSGELIDNGGATYTTWGFCYSTSPNPTTADLLVDNYGYVNNLLTGVTYYVRAYATNLAGTSYGNEVNFTTPSLLPDVVTLQVSNITNTSAEITGNVIDSGYCLGEWGFYMGTSPLPTSNDIVLNNPSSYNFTLNPSDYGITLQPNTTYYVRSYAIACFGANETVYGNQLSFTTLP